MILTILRLNGSAPSLFVRGWPGTFQSSSAREFPAFVRELVPSEGLIRRGNTQIHQ